jgi:hypothetical protein
MPARRVPLHPFFFAVFPIISLYATNSFILTPGSVVAPLACALVLTAVLVIVLARLLADRVRGAAMASWIILSIFLYPSLLAALAFARVTATARSLAGWGIVALIGCVLIARTRRDLRPIGTVLNVVATVALIPPLLTLAPAAWSAATAADPMRASTSSASIAAPNSPDIYYIILDGYGRQDVLSTYYDFDNSDFIDDLRRRGFYIATQSRANYSQTYLSLASSLNSIYLDDLAGTLGTTTDDRKPLGDLIASNRAAATLRQRGYTFVSFATGYTGTEIPGADVYVETAVSLTEFQSLLLEFTPLAPLSNALAGGDFRFATHRSRILQTLETLGQPLTSRRPLFVFAHIGAPHPPFVFGPGGEWIDRGEPFSVRDGSEQVAGGLPEYTARYRQQVAFLNRKVLQMLDRVLASSPEPIVVLQGDHGPGARMSNEDVERTDHWERMAILNAYYFPGRDYGRLYPAISPVNTFRVLLAQYFGDDAPLLPDHSYSSPYHHPYDLHDVTEEADAIAGRAERGDAGHRDRHL